MFRLIGSLILGALVGWLAGKVMDSEGGLTRLTDFGYETFCSRLGR